jgi:hypothetical protein
MHHGSFLLRNDAAEDRTSLEQGTEFVGILRKRSRIHRGVCPFDADLTSDGGHRARMIAGHDLGVYTLVDEVADRRPRIGPDLLGQHNQRSGRGLRQRLSGAYRLRCGRHEHDPLSRGGEHFGLPEDLVAVRGRAQDDLRGAEHPGPLAVEGRRAPLPCG